jgi:hypothetical protein
MSSQKPTYERFLLIAGGCDLKKKKNPRTLERR